MVFFRETCPDVTRLKEAEDSQQEGPPEDSFRQHSCLSFLEKILTVLCSVEEVVLLDWWRLVTLVLVVREDTLFSVQDLPEGLLTAVNDRRVFFISLFILLADGPLRRRQFWPPHTSAPHKL